LRVARPWARSLADAAMTQLQNGENEDARAGGPPRSSSFRPS